MQTVLFIHGFPFDHTVWSPTIDELSKQPGIAGHFHLMAPDLPGFGNARPVDKVMLMERFADFLADLLPKDEKTILCGLSMGGYILMQFAKKYRPLLLAAIFCNTKSEADTAEAAAKRLQFADSLDQDGKAAIAAAVDSLLPPLFRKETPAEIVQALKDRILIQNPVGVAAAARGMAQREDMTAMLQTLDVPALVIAGDSDRISPPESMQKLAERIPGAAFHVVSASGHLPMLENPSETARVIGEFLIIHPPFPI